MLFLPTISPTSVDWRCSWVLSMNGFGDVGPNRVWPRNHLPTLALCHRLKYWPNTFYWTRSRSNKVPSIGTTVPLAFGWVDFERSCWDMNHRWTRKICWNKYKTKNNKIHSTHILRRNPKMGKTHEATELHYITKIQEENHITEKVRPWFIPYEH